MSCFLYCYGNHRDLHLLTHSFPTRRSSVLGDRLDISGVGKVGIGHDRRRVGVDEDNAIALLLERLDRLRPRIVELARLTDNDRAGADDEDGLEDRKSTRLNSSH